MPTELKKIFALNEGDWDHIEAAYKRTGLEDVSLFQMIVSVFDYFVIWVLFRITYGAVFFSTLYLSDYFNMGRDYILSFLIY